MAKAPKRTTRRATTRSTDTPEAKSTNRAKSAAAERMFENADEAALHGLPETMTTEQNENRLRRAALGY